MTTRAWAEEVAGKLVHSCSHEAQTICYDCVVDALAAEVQRAVDGERKACAKLVEYIVTDGMVRVSEFAAQKAAAIRARQRTGG